MKKDNKKDNKIGNALYKAMHVVLVTPIPIPIDILLTNTGGELTKEEQQTFTWDIIGKKNKK